MAIVVARYDKNAGIRGRTQGLRKDAKPAANAIPKFKVLPNPEPGLALIINWLKKGILTIRLNWSVNTNIPSKIKTNPNK